MPESTDTSEDRNSIPTAGSAHSGESAPPSRTDSSDFQTGYVATFTFAHAIHDTYSAFLAPLLPTLITNLSLSMTQAGALDFARTILAILQPLIGHVGDRVNLRYLIILAPAMTGTMMSLLGVAPNYAALILLAVAAGLGSAFSARPGSRRVRTLLGGQAGMGHGRLDAGRQHRLCHRPGNGRGAAGVCAGARRRGTWPEGLRGGSAGRRACRGVHCTAQTNRRTSMPNPSGAPEF